MKIAHQMAGLILVCSLAFSDDGQLAFPGAQGFGAHAKGGRGGKVCLITTLADYGPNEQPIPGSLREAVEAEGPRIVVFRVGGTIELKRSLTAKNPFLTIAGQTAPGGGICLKAWPLIISTNDVIVRHLRVRPGDLSRKAVDGLSVVGGKNVILDHLSVSWGIDETLSVTHESDQVTVQWCMITESLNNSYHPKGKHGYGSLINGGKMSWHHNLYAHHSSRNPRPGDVYLDFRNNVIYNWGGRCGYNHDDNSRINYVGNHLKPGPSTPDSARGFAFWVGSAKSRIYIADNQIEGFPEKNQDNRLMLVPPPDTAPVEAWKEVVVDKPFPVDGAVVNTDPPEAAFERVLGEAGAMLPKRDAVDRRVIEQVKNGAGQHIDSQDQVGGWPELEAGAPPPDSDLDGMPDEWEKRYQLDPGDPSDNTGDLDGDGFTNIEECINGTNPLQKD